MNWEVWVLPSCLFSEHQAILPSIGCGIYGTHLLF